MATPQDPRTSQQNVRRTVTRTLVVLAGMFAFAFALVPLYDVFCQVTGLNGKTSRQAQALVQDGIDESRVITMQFITRSGQGLPWRLDAGTRQVRVHPGQSAEVQFAFENRGQASGMARAVPSVSPAEASLYLRKLACFCFQQQQLAAGERLEAPLVFQLAPDLPAEIKTVTLVYTLYPVPAASAARAGSPSIIEGDDA